MGRHKTEISPENMRKAEKYARDGHKNGTICELMGWETSWLETRKDIRKRFSKKRAERKVWLRKIQDRQAKSFPAMSIFLGKNELEQTDKQDVTSGGKSVQFEILKFTISANGQTSS